MYRARVNRTTHAVGLLALLHLTACGPKPYGMDAGPEDGGVPSDDGGTMVDAGDAGPAPDGGGVDAGDVDSGPPGPSEPSPPAEVTRVGSGGFLLRGTVLAPDSVIDPGEVLIVGNLITCVAASCATEPMADTVTVIDTHGVISPGLIDAHNHLAYDFLSEWEPGILFDSRDVWRDNLDYEAHVEPQSYGGIATDPTAPPAAICPGGTWGELRSLIHGTTTVQGQSRIRTCHDRLARNADHYHGLARGPGEAGIQNMRTEIGGPADMTTAIAEGYSASFSADPPTRRLAVHMCEGLRGTNMAIEFESWAGRDPRSLSRHQGLSLLQHDGDYMGTTYSYSGVSILIHSVILTDAQMMETIDTGSYVVWSPSSNIALYGATAPIARMLELGVTVGLGPDWTPSGEDEMLSEMRYAYDYGQTESIPALTPEQLWRMATSTGAEVVGLEPWIGRLTPGMRADVAVFGRRAADPYRAVLDSRAEDVRLVMVDGAGYYGDLSLEGDTSINGDCDMIDACGATKYLCIKNVPRTNGAASPNATETVEVVREQLLDILAMYGRADLQELIVCE